MRAATAFAVQVAPAQAQTLPRCEVGSIVKGQLNYPGRIVVADTARGAYQVQLEVNGMRRWTTTHELRMTRSCEGVEPQPKTPGFLVGTWEMSGIMCGDEDLGAAIPHRPRHSLTIGAEGGYLLRSTMWSGHRPRKGRWRPLSEAEPDPKGPGPAILLTGSDNEPDWQVSAARSVCASNGRDQIAVKQGAGRDPMMATRIPERSAEPATRKRH